MAVRAITNDVEPRDQRVLLNREAPVEGGAL